MNGITAVICLDDGLGMAFFGKRQSRDRLLIAELAEWSKGKRLWIQPVSAPLFEGQREVLESEAPLDSCGDGEICFLETLSPEPYLHRISRLVIYRWNRLYPSDLRFEKDPAALGFHLTERTEFQGSSHEKITKEVFEK